MQSPAVQHVPPRTPAREGLASETEELGAAASDPSLSLQARPVNSNATSTTASTGGLHKVRSRASKEPAVAPEGTGGLSSSNDPT
jgi:hypothetical protein